MYWLVPLGVAAVRYGMSPSSLRAFAEGTLKLPISKPAKDLVVAALNYLRTGIPKAVTGSTATATVTGVTEYATNGTNGGSRMDIELGKTMGSAGMVNGAHPGLPIATTEWETSWDSDRTGKGAFRTVIYKYPGQKRGVAWGTWTKGPKQGQFVTWRQPMKPITISRKATTIQDYLKAEGVIRKFKGKLATARRTGARRRTRR